MGMESFSVATDLHGDRQDISAVKAFTRFVDDFKPKCRFFLGDVFDFRALRIGADAEEKMHSMKADFEAGIAFLETYRPHVITLGNHDQRLWDVVERDGLKKSGPLVDYAKELIGKFGKATKGTVVLPYGKRKGVYRYGDHRFVHGFDGLDPAKMAATYGNVMYGHGHAIRMAPAANIEEPKVARMIGFLGLKDMDYNRTQTRTLDQEHGWAYGVNIDGKLQVMQARFENNQVAYATSLKVLHV